MDGAVPRFSSNGKGHAYVKETHACRTTESGPFEYVMKGRCMPKASLWDPHIVGFPPLRHRKLFLRSGRFH